MGEIIVWVDARLASTAYGARMHAIVDSRARIDRTALDWAIAVGLALWAQLDLWVFGEAFTAVRGSSALAAPFLLLYTLPLGWRRRRPLEVLCVVMGAAALESVVVGAPVQGIDLLVPMLLVLYSVAAHAERPRALLGLAVGFVAFTVAEVREPEVVTAGDLVIVDASFFVTLGGGVWLVGRYVRARRLDVERSEDRAERLEREQAERTRAALAAERGRIARELHDVIAHSVSLMGVQAGAIERVLERDPERAREALRSIQVTARESVGELGRLLGVLREGGLPSALAPQPGLDALEALIEDSNSAGLSVELKVEGEKRPLPPGVELSAYRVVQEALTNVRKHSPDAHAQVRLAYSRHDLQLSVENDPPPAGDASCGPQLAGSGQGIVGMRERVALYSGSLEARPRADGGFCVHARLPHEETE